jgi:hypothetical protein
MKIMKNILIGLGIMVVLGLVIGAVIPDTATTDTATTDTATTDTATTDTATTDTATTDTATTDTVKADLEILEYDWEWDNGVAYVTGEIKNNTKNHTYSYVQVSITLYDKNKKVVGNTFTNMNDLEPGQVWKFKACVFDHEDVDTYKISDVAGY